ncbi:penicillin-binding protein activator [Derxia gummosa]|uniref:Penicillin-binding protein activator n=1 Tax=Derxia gummosa DSM 723 TaxID=1121388 RepID=A0A8B6XB69_9BURK|nr:penicillin-binding protein activator [Derxia gummosa]
MVAAGLPAAARAQSQSGAGPAVTPGAPPVSVGAPLPARDLPGRPIAAPGPIQIATLLPTKTPAFARAAAALLAGVEAARKTAGAPTELLQFDLPADPAATLDALRRSADAAVQVVLGPMTRSAAQAVAEAGTPGLPVIALAPFDGEPPAGLWPLGLSLDADARQIARVALAEAQAGAPGERPAAAIVNGQPLFRRAAQAFAEEFRAGGGDIALSVDWAAGREAAIGKAIGQTKAGAVFLALDRAGAVAQRPYCGRLSAFATSQIDDGRDLAGQADLDGVRFVELPWRVQPDHPALAGFARPEPPYGAPELDRLYALGIDALRVALEVARGNRYFSFDGATGLISAGDGRIERRGAIATLRDGALVLDGTV